MIQLLLEEYQHQIFLQTWQKWCWYINVITIMKCIVPNVVQWKYSNVQISLWSISHTQNIGYTHLSCILLYQYINKYLHSHQNHVLSSNRYIYFIHINLWDLSFINTLAIVWKHKVKERHKGQDNCTLNLDSDLSEKRLLSLLH